MNSIIEFQCIVGIENDFKTTSITKDNAKADIFITQFICTELAIIVV
jgi:hypothetical protein